MADTADDLINEVLTGTVQALDVPRPVETTIHAIYDDAGRWMSEALGDGDWSIYSQGSGRLGTMVLPPDGGEFDIDSVVVKNIDKTDITQAELKEEVGDVLDDYVKARAATHGPRPTACDESNRGWTLSFNEPFHMDVLPAIPDLNAEPTGILLSDRDLRRWQFSNPIGFADWFFAQMAVEVEEHRTAFAKEANVDVEDVPWWQPERTTLQQTVQVFKAHRNLYFEADDPDRPPSILITTLAAQAYQGERRLVDGVMNAASRMPDLVDRDGFTYVVLNPVQERENFADSWTPTGAARFFAWMDDLQQTIDEALGVRTGFQDAMSILERKFGFDAVQKAARQFGANKTTARNDGRLKVATSGLVGATGATVRPHTFHGA